ncbi:NUDIX hydrolase [Streptomyces acidiscabies]|uniref:NUDIX hydrolase n=1 Tax=Streptomyces acidiscabies TaxID=42234 RepID=A0ABU4MDS5_9ACTN|nr:NUDIX hydrolase [Streptomyces acidiscabies]MDX3025659.1 NUDIX hydrolase [Streptomyces acidiscabies]
MTDQEYGALRASAALWAGTSVLITDGRGRVLIQRVDYRPTCLLPGGAVDANESPAQGAARELHEELGDTMTVGRGLAVDRVSADSLNAPADVRFPGEILHVYDGGTWNDEQIAAIRLPDREITSGEFVEPSRLPDLMSPRRRPPGPVRPACPQQLRRTRSAGERPPDLPRRPGPGRRPSHRPRPAPPPLPHQHRSRAALRGTGMGLAPWPRRPSPGAPGVGHRRGLPARRRLRTPGPGQPSRHIAPGGDRGSCGRVRRTAVPRSPLRSRRAVRTPPLRSTPHPSRPAFRRSGHRTHPHPGPGHTRAGPGTLRLGTPSHRPALRRPPRPGPARYPPRRTATPHRTAARHRPHPPAARPGPYRNEDSHERHNTRPQHPTRTCSRPARRKRCIGCFSAGANRALPVRPDLLPGHRHPG